LPDEEEGLPDEACQLAPPPYEGKFFQGSGFTRYVSHYGKLPLEAAAEALYLLDPETCSPYHNKPL